jgi:TPP-dependent pyruvate/acetoin dehydrogenase alpha subunit
MIKELNSLKNPKINNDNPQLTLLDDSEYINLLKKMITIRIAEEIISENVKSGLIKCPCHLAIGQEAIPAGVSHFLNSSDRVYGNHRSHGHYLSLTMDTYGLFAEILGKKTGCSKGMGGSMHIVGESHGFGGSVPIVSATIPVSVGAGLAMKLSKNKSISVSYFGDGTSEEGVLHESLNIASYYELPVIFICENNLFSSHMHISERQTFDSISRFADAHGIDYAVIDGNNIETVLNTSKKAINFARNKRKPFFIEAVTYRWKGHVGHDDNIDVGLKRQEDLAPWKEKDPIARLKNSLIAKNILNESDFLSLNNEIFEKLSTEFSQAVADPFPEKEQLLNTVYYK